MPSTPQDRKPSKKGKKKDQAIPVAETDPTSKYAPNAWLSGGVGSLFDFEVPSGQLCLLRRPGMEGLMKAGVLHNVDTLSQIVNSRHLGEDKKTLDVKSLADDEEAISQVSYVVDKVVVHCVVKPEIQMTPNDVTLRKPGVVYTDMVDLVDKMAIFNFVVGGTRDMESFRSGLLESVGSVELGSSVPMPGK